MAATAESKRTIRFLQRTLAVARDPIPWFPAERYKGRAQIHLRSPDGSKGFTKKDFDRFQQKHEDIVTNSDLYYAYKSSHLAPWLQQSWRWVSFPSTLWLGERYCKTRLICLQAEFRPTEGEDHHLIDRRYFNLFPCCSNQYCGQIIRTREKKDSSIFVYTAHGFYLLTNQGRELVWAGKISAAWGRREGDEDEVAQERCAAYQKRCANCSSRNESRPPPRAPNSENARFRDLTKQSENSFPRTKIAQWEYWSGRGQEGDRSFLLDAEVILSLISASLPRQVLA
jgi:hypothetical protein